MNNLGPAAEFLRISEHYRQMSDGELLDLAQDPSELTDVAQQALASEISHRGLTIPSAKPALRRNAVPLPDPADPNSPEYDDDRQLVEICTVWSQRDALQLQTLLDNAGIPFFMGPENATGVDAVTSNFADGVSVRVMQVGVPWARQAMQTYEPLDDQIPKDQAEPEDLPVQCPKCRSAEVVFDELVPDESAPAANAPQKFKWICESCGHDWEDDGIVKEA
jgi:DNA-directed RNA polymerase subunit M/transcription elongation factor TFIIS